MKKPWTLRKRVFLSSVAIMGIVTFLLSVFNVMEIYLTERNTTAFETYMNLSTFFDSLSEAGGYLEEYLYTENEDSLTDYDEAIQTAEQSIENLDPAFLKDQMWHFQLLENMLYSYEDLGAEAIRKIEVENFPVIVVADCHGNNLYETAVKEYRSTEKND